MKRKVMIGLLLTTMLFSGCVGENEKIFNNAEEALVNSSYAEALQGYEISIQNNVKQVQSCRGAGIANLRLGNYEEAVKYFDDALKNQRLSDELRRDILQYKTTAYMKNKEYEKALSVCTMLAEYKMDAQSYYLRGMAELYLDSYDKAALDFQSAFSEDGSTDMAIRIYQVYVEKNMEADGTRYLEAALNNAPQTTEDYCDRGRVYYYMEDYDNAGKALTEAVNQGNMDAILLMGKVYMKKGDVSNARALYQQYISGTETAAEGYNGLALCDIAEGKYDSAMENLNLGMNMADSDEKRDIMYNQVVVFEKLMDYEAAYNKIQEYIALFPEDREAQRENIFLSSRMEEAAAEINPVTEEENTSDDQSAYDESNVYDESNIYGG